MADAFLMLPILLFSGVVYEVPHRWMALLTGDTTAKDMGRLPVNPMNFRNIGRDNIRVPAVGPFSNLLVALGCALLVDLWSGTIGPVDRSTIGLEGSLFTLLPRMLLIGILKTTYIPCAIVFQSAT